MMITMGLTVFLDLVTAVARQLERLELDSVVSVPLMDRTFFAGDETLGADPFSASPRASDSWPSGGTLPWPRPSS